MTRSILLDRLREQSSKGAHDGCPLCISAKSFKFTHQLKDSILVVCGVFVGIINSLEEPLVKV